MASFAKLDSHTQPGRVGLPPAFHLGILFQRQREVAPIDPHALVKTL